MIQELRKFEKDSNSMEQQEAVLRSRQLAIAVTANCVHSSDADALLQHGFDAVLSKPVTVQDLLWIVESQLPNIRNKCPLNTNNNNSNSERTTPIPTV